MKTLIDSIPKFENPELLDRVIYEVQKGLKDNLSWLDYAFGRAKKIRKIVGSKKFSLPNVFAGKGNYIDVSPDANIGNFCFFYVEDPQEYEVSTNIQSDLSAEYSLIFWYDVRKIPGAEEGNTEFVKSEILKTLNRKFRLSSGRMTISEIFEEAENIYRGFTLDEVDNQFLMFPYAGLKITGNIMAYESCKQ